MNIILQENHGVGTTLLTAVVNKCLSFHSSERPNLFEIEKILL